MKNSVVRTASAGPYPALPFVLVWTGVELFTLVIAIGLLDLARRLKDLHFYHELRPKIVFSTKRLAE
jgi:hypothetical protein